jgi:hypothetical protein
MKKVILILTINVATSIICFSVVEIYLRMNKIQPYVRSFPGQYRSMRKEAPWMKSDSYFGWIANREYSETKLEINPQGFRDPKDFNSIDLNSGKIRIMILGDSFIWGTGSTAKETVPNFLQIILKDEYEVFNLGIPGWGVDQMYLAYKKYKDVIRPSIVILAFIDDDVRRVLEAYTPGGTSKPSFTINNGELVFRTSTSKSELFLNKIMGKSVFLSLITRVIYTEKVARPIVKELFLKMVQETEHRREKFVVVRIPYKEQKGNFIRKIEWHLRSFKDVFKYTNVQYLELLEEMTKTPTWVKDFYIEDGHMSPAGNKYLAAYIYKHVFQNP